MDEPKALRLSETFEMPKIVAKWDQSGRFWCDPRTSLENKEAYCFMAACYELAHALDVCPFDLSRSVGYEMDASRWAKAPSRDSGP